MTEAEIIRLIKQQVRMTIAQTLLGSFTDTDNAYVGSVKRFSTDSELEGLRLIRPYGFVSRPPIGTNTVVHPINGDATHLITLGDFDLGNRPSIADEESAVYGPEGQLVHLKSNGDVVFGDYLPATGTILPTFRGKLSSDGAVEFQNTLGAWSLSPDGSSSFENLIGSIEITPSGQINLDGGTGASHGVGLGDIIESRLAALELNLAALIVVYNAHIAIPLNNGVVSPPFIPVPIPVESLTVKVSL